MKKKLYKIALISSPLLAIITAAPTYMNQENKETFFISVWVILTIFIFICWIINIFLISKISYNNIFKRYFLSYLTVFLIQCFNIFILTYLKFKPQEYNLLLPFLGAIALNTLIIIISNSIILQFQKESAELEIEQLKVGNLEAQKQKLLQQLQPHFLFNALSTLKSLISENPNVAEEYVVKLSDFLRYSIQAKNNELTTLDEELKFTKDYFDLQKVRFGDALNYEIDLPIFQFEKKIPIFAIQTLVENAIKHNSFTNKNPLYIKVSTIDNKIKVQNNKVQKTLILPSGTGLRNLNSRYNIISNTEIEIIETKDDFIVLINLL